MADGDQLRLTIQPLPDARPDAPDQWQRLRLILKKLPRVHRWKCVKIEPVDEPDDAPGGAS